MTHVNNTYQRILSTRVTCQRQQSTTRVNLILFAARASPALSATCRKVKTRRHTAKLRHRSGHLNDLRNLYSENECEFFYLDGPSARTHALHTQLTAEEPAGLVQLTNNPFVLFSFCWHSRVGVSQLLKGCRRAEGTALQRGKFFSPQAPRSALSAVGHQSERKNN